MSPLSTVRHVMPDFGAFSVSRAEGGMPGGKMAAADLQQLTNAYSLGTTSLPALQPLTLRGETGVATPASADGSFSGVLGRLVQEVNRSQTVAGDAIRGLQSGQDVSLHQAVIAMEEASVSFQLMVEVRNKLLESYQELMRMQI